MKANERRFTPRYNLRIPLRIQRLGEAKIASQSVESTNVSARGIYFASDLLFQVGTPLQILFQMPEEVTGRVSPEWNCRGRVVRIDTGAKSCDAAGIGVEIQYYEISKAPDAQIESLR